MIIELECSQLSGQCKHVSRNSPVRAKALTLTPLLTSFGCSKIAASDHTDNLDAKHDGSHITRMTCMLKEQRHPTVSDHLDATVYIC